MGNFLKISEIFKLKTSSRKNNIRKEIEILKSILIMIIVEILIEI